MEESRQKQTADRGGAAGAQKPEAMTQLFGNVLVAKDHPRILLRGKLDTLQAQIVLIQALLAREGASALLADLDDILRVVRAIARCEVLGEALTLDTILGMRCEELHARSHDPMKYYKLRQLLPPEHTMGLPYALVNLLRATLREAEVAAVAAFREGEEIHRGDLIEGLNRLSSAAHIMMCRCLAGEYRTEGAGAPAIQSALNK